MGILIHKYALFLGYSALEVICIDDAMSIDKDFNSNTSLKCCLISNSVDVLVEGSNKQAVLVAEKNLILRLDESEEDSNSKSNEVTDVETKLQKE